VFLLGRHAKDTGISELLGAQALEERVGAVGRLDDFAILDGDPLALQAPKHLGQTERFHDPTLYRIPNYTVVIQLGRSVQMDNPTLASLHSGRLEQQRTGDDRDQCAIWVSAEVVRPRGMGGQGEDGGGEAEAGGAGLKGVAEEGVGGQEEHGRGQVERGQADDRPGGGGLGGAE
jgi:hypothetical protein